MDWQKTRYLPFEVEDLLYGARHLVFRLAFNHEFERDLGVFILGRFFSFIRFPELETITLVVDPKVCRPSCGLEFIDP